MVNHEACLQRQQFSWLEISWATDNGHVWVLKAIRATRDDRLKCDWLMMVGD